MESVFEIFAFLAVAIGVVIVLVGLWRLGWHVRWESQDRKWSVDNIDAEPEDVDIEQVEQEDDSPRTVELHEEPQLEISY